MATIKVRTLALGLAGLLIIATIVLSLMPLPRATTENIKEITGMVSSVELNEKTKDVVFRFRNSNKYYYINRGLESIKDIAGLEKLIGEEVSILIIKQWNPLYTDPYSNHIAQLSYKGTIIYTEILKPNS